jgi:hypothetical protein
MGEDHEAGVVLYGVVDRLEDEVAVVVLEGGHAAFLPRLALPRGAAEGSGLRVQIRLAANPWRARVREEMRRLREQGG